MTAPELYASPHRVLWAWTAALGALLGLLVAADVALGTIARHREERDYRRPLAEVAAQWERPGFSPTEAKRAIDQALDLAPDRPEPHVMLGHLHYRLGHWAQAIAAYERALACGAREVGLHQNMVWCRVELGDYDGAAELGLRALDADQADPLLHRYTAEALFRAGRFAEARPHYEAALANSPEDRHLMNRLVEVYLALGEIEAARSMETRISEAEARLGTLGVNGP